MHLGECLVSSTACYRCGQEGHFVRDCPSGVALNQPESRNTTPEQTSEVRGSNRRGPQTRQATSAETPRGGLSRPPLPRGQPGIPRTQARIYAVTQQDVETAPDVVTGIISLFDLNSQVLIDPGATHSFISIEFTARLKMALDPSYCNMIISLPT